ncbi:MAG: SAP domain-containing protein [Gammaproteobacteria bacterium]|nr:SAP domain-containing protein [Gammaproteobacteria bacterium]
MIMHMQEIRKIAQTHGLKTSRLSKSALVRLIQGSEGNFECFATALNGECDQLECCWREDCLGQSQSGLN